jgi:cytochrome P450
MDASALSRFSLSPPPPGFIDDPYPWYAALRAQRPVHALGPTQHLLTRHADVLAVYRHPAALSDKAREFAPKFGLGTPLYEHHTTSLVFNDPPLHTRVRRILMGALNQRAIARMEAGVVALVAGLLERLAAEPAPDLIAHFAAQIPVEVIGNLLAMPHAERGPLREWSLAILSALEPAPAPERLARGHAAVSEFLAYLRGLVAERERHPGDPDADVLTRLIQGDGQGRLSPEELMHNCIFLLNAGHETTTNLIGNGMLALLQQPDAWAALCAEPALLPTAVEELLRWDSPLQLNNRLAGAPIELPSGAILEAGSFITLCIGAANRDPAAFEHPERLDLARRPNSHLAFGQGAHACSGMNVARLEARVALGALAVRWPRLALRAPPLRDPRVRFRGLVSLPVSLG